MKFISAAIVVLAGAAVVGPALHLPHDKLPAVLGGVVMAFGLWKWTMLLKEDE